MGFARPAPAAKAVAGFGGGGVQMRALGPGSVSSFLKIILDVVYAALLIGLGAVALMILAAILFSFNPDILSNVTLSTDAATKGRGWPLEASGLAGAGLYMGGILIIVGSLRRIFTTLTAGDPFHPDNVRRLRVIGGVLAVLELVRYPTIAITSWVAPEAWNGKGFSVNPTAWFAILVVFVLAEVFREGARLRREAELTI